MSEGTRTPDRLDHNQELYQLSYAHHAHSQSSDGHRCEPAPGRRPRQSSARGGASAQRSERLFSQRERLTGRELRTALGNELPRLQQPVGIIAE